MKSACLTYAVAHLANPDNNLLISNGLQRSHDLLNFSQDAVSRGQLFIDTCRGAGQLLGQRGRAVSVKLNEVTDSIQLDKLTVVEKTHRALLFPADMLQLQHDWLFRA